MNKEIVRFEQYSFDERYYQREVGPNLYEYAPSMTYVLSCVYPAHELADWRGDVGNKRADEIMNEAGEDGNFVHDAIERMIKGETITSVDIEAKFTSRRSLKVKRCLKAFLDWYREFNPKIISCEYAVWGEGYAGTVDLKCMIGEETYIVDFKTSKSVHNSHKVQIAGYGMADGKVDKIAILHLGNTTKKKYSFLVLDDDVRERFEKECKMAVNMFHTLNPNAKPTDETFPETFLL